MSTTAKNTFYLFIAYAYQKIVAFFYFILLARYLGADDLGKYTFAISFVVLFSVFIYFGLSPVLIRQIARDKSKAKSYLDNVFSFRLLAGLVVFAIICILINILKYPPTTKALVYLSSLITFVDSLALTIYQVFRGYLNLKFESLGIIVHKTVMFIIGIILMKLGANVVLMMLPLLVGSLFYLSNALFFLKKKLKFWPRFHFNKYILKFLFRLAIPFFIALIFSKLFATIDIVLLSKMAGDKFVGLYSVSQKITLAILMLVAGSLGTAIYPSFSYWFVRSRERLNQLFQKGFFYLILIGLPLSFGLVVLTKPIILLIYGKQYLPAVPAMILLSMAMPFMFLDYILVGLFNACEKQKINTIIHGIGVLVLIISNIILIPYYKHVGSALSCLIGYLVIFVLEMTIVPKLVKIDINYLSKKLTGIFLATLLMSVTLFWAREKINVILLSLIGAIIYFLVLYLAKTIRRGDLINIKNLIIKT